MSRSYKEFLGIDEEAIEFEWNIFPGFSSLQILQQKIPNDLRNRDIEPEKLTDRIIFMSMFNDIDWTKKGYDGLCVSNSEKKARITRRDSCKDTGRFSVLDRKKKWHGTLPCTPEGKWDSTANQVERFKETGHPAFKSIGASSRRILKKKNGRDTIHFNADAAQRSYFESFVLQISSVFTEQLRLGVKQFGLTEEEKGQEKPKESVTKDVLTCVKSQDVKLLVSPPKQASGNNLQENIHDFDWLNEIIQLKRVCELAWFRLRISAGKKYTTRPDEDDGFGQLIP